MRTKILLLIATMTAISAVAATPITYKITGKSNESYSYNDNARLTATINGQRRTAATYTQMFGDEGLGNPELIAVLDVNGDGYNDALVADICMGTGQEMNMFTVVFYNPKTQRFVCAEPINNGIYGVKARKVGGVNVVDIVGNDLGQESVIERYIVKGLKLVEGETPARAAGPKVIATLPLNEENGTSISVDLNGDGVKDTLKLDFAAHFFSGVQAIVDGDTYDFNCECLYGEGALGVTTTLTNGMYDLILTDNVSGDRTLIKWNGETYEAIR